MASSKLTKFAMCFLIILHYSFVNAHESSGRKTKFAAKIPYDEEDAFIHKKGEYIGERKRMGGRKMVQREEELKKRSEKDGSSNVHEPIFSGSVATTKKPFQKISPPAIEVSTSSMVENQDSKKMNEDESEEIYEAADEVVNMMMRKDYKGPDRPRHKPPINNHNPTDWP